MKINVKYMTNNDCYNANRKITPKGVMIHSTASPGVMASEWFDRWNKSYKKGETNRQVCTHAFVDNKEAWQYLPWNHRGWHCGGDGNNTHIGIEICEPSGFKYSGSTMVGYDVNEQQEYFNAIWKNAIELTAQLCEEFNLDPEKEGVVLCHSEGHSKGIASNHADVMHWFPKHGKDMDDFRKAVKAVMNGEDIFPEDEENSSGNPYPVPTESLHRGDKGDNVRWLQTELNRYGYNLDVDGSFGAATLAAVKDYQKNNNLEVDGSVGPLTRQSLINKSNGNSNSNPYPVPTKTLKRGSKGEDVKWLQTALNHQSYNLDVDGSFGAATLAAVKDYQKKSGLEVDGSFGPASRASLIKDEEEYTSTDSKEEIVYVVQSGDTLTKIANKYNTTWKELAEYNNLKDPGLINVGQEIRIPN